ncbi:MAG: sigma-70 family RNA polymerase sigma factor [Thermomicrobiales bacterium]|nr:sigma-70 family RNA polymerase sigma factor [Thermomicrobiales bacterium]
MIELSDLEVMELIAQQDSHALQTLFSRYGRRCFALSYRIINNAQSAEEVVQDTFQAVWQKASQFDAERGGNVRGWLLTIVHRKSIDYRRREIDRRPPDVPIDDVDFMLSVPDIFAEVDQILLQERVRSALANLPPEQRRIIELAYFSGLSQSDIAAAENLPLGTVKGRTRLGLRKLSELLHMEQDQSDGVSATGGRP